MSYLVPSIFGHTIDPVKAHRANDFASYFSIVEPLNKRRPNRRINIFKVRTEKTMRPCSERYPQDRPVTEPSPNQAKSYFDRVFPNKCDLLHESSHHSIKNRKRHLLPRYPG